MKTHLARMCAVLALAVSVAAQAAAPPLLPLQGVLTDPDGVPIGAAVAMRFSLHTADTAGTEVWHETQTITPVDGLFAAYLGQGTGGTMTLATFRDQGELWLEVKVGSDEPMARVRLASVAYAGYAEYCGVAPAHTHAAADITGTIPAGSLPAGTVIGAQACPDTQKVTGVTAAGVLECAADADTDTDTTYSGADFALSNQACPGTQKVTGVSAAGAVECAADTDTTYTAGAGLVLAGTELSLAAAYADGSAFDARFVKLPAEPFPGSSLLSAAQQAQLNRWVGTPLREWTLCYRRSTHGASSATFHSQCDHRGPTVTVISANSKLFGGYTSHSWNQRNTYWGNDASFLYSLTNGARYPLGYYPENSIYSHSSYGPTFGNGHDIHVDSNMNLGYCNFPYAYSYNGAAYPPNATASNALCGRYTGAATAIDELEVWYYQ